nr:hypothetical protein [Escherichia coli]
MNKTKRQYISIMPRPDSRTAVMNQVVAVQPLQRTSSVQRAG